MSIRNTKNRARTQKFIHNSTKPWRQNNCLQKLRTIRKVFPIWKENNCRPRELRASALMNKQITGIANSVCNQQYMLGYSLWTAIKQSLLIGWRQNLTSEIRTKTKGQLCVVVDEIWAARVNQFVGPCLISVYCNFQPSKESNPLPALYPAERKFRQLLCKPTECHDAFFVFIVFGRRGGGQQSSLEQNLVSIIGNRIRTK